MKMARGVFFLCLVMSSAKTCFADLYHGPETLETHKVDKDDFVGRHNGESIPKFIDRVVNPDDTYIRHCKRTIDSVAELMRSKLFSYKVAQTIKGGSLGKGTAVKELADADLLFPLSEIQSVKELRTQLPDILKVLQSALARSDHTVTEIRRTPFTIQFKIKIGNTFQEVDLLPIMDLKIKDLTKDSPALKKVYQDMKKDEELREYYGKCLAFLQVNFVSQIPEKVKRVIRLLKYWSKTRKHSLKSYASELLVIKVFEELGSPRSITEGELITKTFLKLSDLKTLKVSWNKYYDPKTFTIPSPPYILDPARPYHNLIRQKSGGIDDKYVFLEKDAKRILKLLRQQERSKNEHVEF